MKTLWRTAAFIVNAWLACTVGATDTAWQVELNVRLRVEAREQNFTFNETLPSVTDDTWLLTRLRVGLNGEIAPGWTLYTQAQDSREFDSARPSVPFVAGSEGDDPFDLRQFYLERKGSWMAIRVGRQVLAFGDERLIGPLDWNNFARTFDAARLTLPQIGDGLDLFVSSVVQIQPGSQDGWRANHSSRRDVLGGAYARFSPVALFKVEPYLLYRAATSETVYFAGTAGTARPYDVPQKIATLGGRFVGRQPTEKPAGFDYDAEIAGQIGEVRGRQLAAGTLAYPGPAWLDHRAWAVHAGLGYSGKTAGQSWRIYAEMNRASGDRNPVDANSESFLNLFPTNHKFYGAMDTFAWKNLRELALAASTTVKAVKVRLEQHWFALDRVSDSWFRANAVTAVRPLTAAAQRASRHVGAETDVVISSSFGKHMALEGGFSYFLAGRYLDDTGGGSDAKFVYLQTALQW